MHLIFRTALMLCTMLVFVAQALAADVRSYAVLPFKVNGSSGFTYLEKAIPSMLNSRLYWQGHFQPVADAALAKAGAVSDAGSAAKGPFRHRCRLCHLGRRDGHGRQRQP